MKTQLLKKYSAQLVKDCFKVGYNYYRAVEMVEMSKTMGQKVYALQDIKNGGTKLIAVTMKEIMDFIGENYELVSTVATYDTPLSQYARYILPQTEEMWRVSWKVYFEGETQSWQKAIGNESEHDDEFFVEQAKVEISALKYVNNKIDEIFEELKKVKHVLFREDLSEKSVNEILKLLPDYIPNEYDEAFKVVNDKEYFIIEPTEYENNDGIEYAIDEGYKAYFKVSYHFVTELNSILSLNLEQRHHCFYAEMIY